MRGPLPDAEWARLDALLLAAELRRAPALPPLPPLVRRAAATYLATASRRALAFLLVRSIS